MTKELHNHDLFWQKKCLNRIKITAKSENCKGVVIINSGYQGRGNLKIYSKFLITKFHMPPKFLVTQQKSSPSLCGQDLESGIWIWNSFKSFHNLLLCVLKASFLPSCCAHPQPNSQNIMLVGFRPLVKELNFCKS